MRRILPLAIRRWGLWCLLVAVPGHAAHHDGPPSIAERIVALSPHAAELICAAGAGPKLVGAVSHSDYPPEVASLPRIGDAVRLDRERIVALAPDLAVAWTSGNREGDLSWLEARGIRIYRSDPARIADIPADLIAIGRLAGTEPKAQVAARDLVTRLAALEAARPGGPTIRAFYLLWDSPLMTLGGDSLINQVMGLCGLENLFATESAQALAISRESLLAARPEAIVRPRDIPLSEVISERLWTGPPPTVIPVDQDLLHRPGPRLLEGAERLCESVAELKDASLGPRGHKTLADGVSDDGVEGTPPRQ